jgi:thiosulfate/3-mercaptopyruvate sulfurtransferase
VQKNQLKWVRSVALLIFESKIAMQKIAPLIKPELLGQLMNDEDLVLIDARTGPGAKQAYSEKHIRGALFVDLDTDLSKKTSDAANGGRHPLPPVKDFAGLLGKLGIGRSTPVVAYDDKSGANAAARFWWMMKALGHENIRVLDGGLKAAKEAGLPMSSETPVIEEKEAYPVDKWILPTTDIDQVARAAADPSYLVIDVREGFRYRGESEPIDTIAGHIPGAVNVPYTGNLDTNGNFLSTTELAQKYKDAIGDRDMKQVIVHCGSGVTACHTLLAMDQAGLEIPNLYVGSWSEWSRNDRPVAVEK